MHHLRLALPALGFPHQCGSLRVGGGQLVMHLLDELLHLLQLIGRASHVGDLLILGHVLQHCDPLLQAPSICLAHAFSASGCDMGQPVFGNGALQCIEAVGKLRVHLKQVRTARRRSALPRRHAGSLLLDVLEAADELGRQLLAGLQALLQHFDVLILLLQHFAEMAHELWAQRQCHFAHAVHRRTSKESPQRACPPEAQRFYYGLLNVHTS
mmetsp:Transcript_117748/g.333754  ORF Transcript_117748/g.333754 Transcript_117748/m.333754 type:complete len:212 (+) Transcript_117748:577-1212(+)